MDAGTQSGMVLPVPAGAGPAFSQIFYRELGVCLLGLAGKKKAKEKK